MFIDGKPFPIRPSDLVLPYILNTTAKAETGYNISCISAIQLTSAGSGGDFLLGEPFLKNVLAVADWGTKEMRLVTVRLLDSEYTDMVIGSRRERTIFRRSAYDSGRCSNSRLRGVAIGQSACKERRRLCAKKALVDNASSASCQAFCVPWSRTMKTSTSSASFCQKSCTKSSSLREMMFHCSSHKEQSPFTSFIPISSLCIQNP